MINFKKILYRLLPLLLVALGCRQSHEVSETQVLAPIVISLTSEKIFNAGELKTLTFKVDNNASVSVEGLWLHLSHSYGNIMVKPSQIGKSLHFEIPHAIAKKSGIIVWDLTKEKNTVLSGSISILPLSQMKPEIEVYFGPPSIIAGENDHAMITAFPSDLFDNLMLDGTKLNYSHHYLGVLYKEEEETKNRFSWKRISSYESSGRITGGVTTTTSSSQELIFNVLPKAGENFQIVVDSIHTYADGHEIIRFGTSVIKDKFGNIVSDGTQVEFIITNKEEVRLFTSGTTINGIAESVIRHPDKPTVWDIKARIAGAAESNRVSIDFKNAISDFEFAISKKGNQIAIGPIRSFLGQLIPEGTLVSLAIVSDGIYLQKESRKGMVYFNISKEKIVSEETVLEVLVMGYKKTISLKEI